MGARYQLLQSQGLTQISAQGGVAGSDHLLEVLWDPYWFWFQRRWRKHTSIHLSQSSQGMSESSMEVLIQPEGNSVSARVPSGRCRGKESSETSPVEWTKNPVVIGEVVWRDASHLPNESRGENIKRFSSLGNGSERPRCYTQGTKDLVSEIPEFFEMAAIFGIL